MSIWILILLLPAVVQASSYEYEYATACIPYSYDRWPERNQCSLLILGRSTVNIEIHTAFENSSFTLPAGTVYQREFEIEFHPISGQENKAIRISSTDEIQVLMYKSDTGRMQHYDVIMVQNQIRNNDTYFTSAYNGNNDECIDSYSRNQFYLVSSFYSDTFISVRQQDGTTYELTLPEYGTFVQTTNTRNNHLASGTKITSSKPINVVSGNLCAFNRHSLGGTHDSYVSDVPRVESLGTEYVVPKIISDDVDERPAGYSVGVVATEDNTLVVSDGEVRWIDEGETAMYQYRNKANSIYVNCSKPCLVSQYTKPIFNLYGMFMQNILSEEQFSTSAFFTTLYAGFTFPTLSYLSLVIQGETPGDDIFLNDTSLGFLTWTTVNGYSSAELAIPEGAYDLLSENGRPFAAYVYLHNFIFNGASGYALLPMGSSGMTTTPPTSPTSPSTTPTPSANGTLPLHTVRVNVNGTALTSDGQDISPQCAMAHLNNLKQKNARMLVEVNEAIGQSICMDSGDLVDVLGLQGVSVQGNKALIRIDHVLKVDWHHVAVEVEMCALEVGVYLNDLSNWPQPIFPGVPDCSGLEIQPEYFNTSGTYWNCDSQMDEVSDLYASNTLSYEINVSKILATQDSSILDIACTNAYASEAGKKTTAMSEEISMALSGSGCHDIVSTVTHTTSLIGLGEQAYFVATFFYLPSPVASFSEFLVCMQQVQDFCMQHQNWSPGNQPSDPFLPVPPGCPALEHEGDTLDNEGATWRCV